MQLRRIHWRFEVSYNVAPTQSVPVVRFANGEREGLMMRWGMIPFSAKGIAPNFPSSNARIEKLETAPTWRGPWGRAQRCILPAAGFYEWHMNEACQKHPFFIRLADQEVFGFAALWDRSITTDRVAVLSCALITMPANELMRRIHNAGAHPFRMPAILLQTDHDAWLRGSVADAKDVLRQYPQDQMVAYQVSRWVNNSKNDGKKLIEPAHKL